MSDPRRHVEAARLNIPLSQPTGTSVRAYTCTERACFNDVWSFTFQKLESPGSPTTLTRLEESGPWTHRGESRLCQGCRRHVPGAAWRAAAIPARSGWANRGLTASNTGIGMRNRLRHDPVSSPPARVPLRFKSCSHRYLAGCTATLLHRAGCPRGRTGPARPRADKSMG